MGESAALELLPCQITSATEAWGWGADQLPLHSASSSFRLLQTLSLVHSLTQQLSFCLSLFALSFTPSCFVSTHWLSHSHAVHYTLVHDTLTLAVFGIDALWVSASCNRYYVKSCYTATISRIGSDNLN